MEFFTSLALFIIGFFILIKGAGILVNGATSVAHVFRVSSWFIGMVIIGFGTSIPEFSISIASVFDGNNIGLGTIIGTNVFNTLVIFGLSAIFVPIIMKKEWVIKDLVINIAATAVGSAVILLSLLGDSAFVGVTREEGAVLFVLLIFWIWSLFKRTSSEEESAADYHVFTVFTSLVMITAGFIGVFLGGKWVVDGAETIATLIGASPTLIALTIVAIGTSLPELVVSIVAMFKRNTGIAVGNIIGSNIFDFLGILGITALIHPIPVFENLQFDILATFGATTFLFLFMVIGKRYRLVRTEGLILCVLYVAYISFVIVRG